MAKSVRPFNLSSASAAFIAIAGFAAPALPAVASARPLDSLLPAISLPTVTLDLSRIAPAPDVAIATDPTPANEVHAAVEAPASGADVSCMAKVVHHEAANQSRDGQLAVAQVIRNRTQASGFARSVCGVVAQRGQFFDVASYTPTEDGRWQTALSVAREALSADTAQIVPGALFYRASWSSVPSFMRHRRQVAVLGDHVFYR